MSKLVDRNSAALTDRGPLPCRPRSRPRGALRRGAKPGAGQVVGSIGYSTRKLGDIDKGINYYHQALERDPDYTKARQYLGEAYLQKGDVGKAKEQLIEIANRCGGPCEQLSNSW